IWEPGVPGAAGIGRGHGAKMGRGCEALWLGISPAMGGKRFGRRTPVRHVAGYRQRSPSEPGRKSGRRHSAAEPRAAAYLQGPNRRFELVPAKYGRGAGPGKEPGAEMVSP